MVVDFLKWTKKKFVLYCVRVVYYPLLIIFIQLTGIIRFDSCSTLLRISKISLCYRIRVFVGFELEYWRFDSCFTIFFFVFVWIGVLVGFVLESDGRWSF